MYKKLVFLIIFLASISIAHASNLAITTINDQISPYDYASYAITVFNDREFADSYFITSKDLRWSISTEPLTDYTTGLSVPAMSQKSTILLIKPREVVPFGRHDIEILLTSKETNKTLKETISVNVRQDLIKWPTDVSMSVDVPPFMDPRRVSVVKVILKNNNPLHVSNLTIRLKSSLFEKEAEIELLSKQEKTVDFSITFNASMPPQKDKLSVTLLFNGSVVKQISKDYEVKPFSGFRIESSESKKFLKRTKVITYTNDGTAVQRETIFIEASLSKKIFTSTNPKLDFTKIDGIYYYTGEIELQPGQAAKVTITTNYRPLLYLGIIIVMLILIYFATRAPVIVRKEARDIEVVEGGISKIKLIIKVRNRSRNTIRNLRLIDRIPIIAHFIKEGAETLKPEKVFSYAGGTAVRYNIKSIEPEEVIIITYEIKTKLGVVGNLRLKPAIVEYDERKSYSNAVDVYVP